MNIFTSRIVTIIVLRSYSYQIEPTKAQERRLFDCLYRTRELYNAALQERQDAWKKQGVSRSYFDQAKTLAEVRDARPEFGEVPIVMLRGALRRLDRSFQAFFRRCKTGEKPGYPRFKSARRWSSILIDDLRGKSPIVAGGKRVSVPLLGKIKLKMHRPFSGKPKAMRITLDARGRWFVTFACVDVLTKPQPKTEQAVGIDLGLHHFVATSDGETIDNPRPLAKARIKLERAQRRVSSRKRGSKRRRKAVRLLAIQHERVANVRREHHIQTAKSLVKKYDTIYVEDLNIKGLARSFLAKSVNDAAWGDFLHWLRTKAEEAGRVVLEVDPRGTSQTCPDCGDVKPKPLSQRIHRCQCGLVCDRDVAAALVILERGQRFQREAVASGTPRRPEKSESKRHQQPKHIDAGDGSATELGQHVST